MKLTEKIQKAIDFAARKHARQWRKSGGLPYIVHPFSVAWILADYVEDEDVVVAGLLHDILEDVKGSSFEEIKKEFGIKVARIVKDVSEDKNPNFQFLGRSSWQKRKEKYIAHLRAAPVEAIYVSAADKIHNLKSLQSRYGAEGDKLWKTFNAGRDKSLWFYEEVMEVVKKRIPGHPLSALYEQIFNEIKNLL